jgi:hypothetical protein
MRYIAQRLLPLAILAACAPTKRPSLSPSDPAAREAILLTSHETAPGRHCSIVDPEVLLPNVAAVLDTAAMPEYLRQEGVSADGVYALYSLRYDSAGKPVRANLIEATFADSLAKPVQAAVGSALLARSAGSPLAARLRIDFGAAPTYRLGRSEYCMPERIVENIAPDPNGIAIRMGPSTPKSITTYKYEVEVSPVGHVEDVRFLSAIDVQLAEDLRVEVKKQHWKPALDDGMPVTGHALSSVILETRTRTMLVP